MTTDHMDTFRDLVSAFRDKSLQAYRNAGDSSTPSEFYTLWGAASTLAFAADHIEAVLARLTEPESRAPAGARDLT